MFRKYPVTKVASILASVMLFVLLWGAIAVVGWDGAGSDVTADPAAVAGPAGAGPPAPRPPPPRRRAAVTRPGGPAAATSSGPGARAEACPGAGNYHPSQLIR